MEQAFHPFSELFAQLGLPSDRESIDSFINAHAPVKADVQLADAPCWTPAQASLLREEILLDADWAETVDQLNLALRRVG
jgi:hypothetical protein